jgi:hypothetical protein
MACEGVEMRLFDSFGNHKFLLTEIIEANWSRAENEEGKLEVTLPDWWPAGLRRRRPY